MDRVVRTAQSRWEERIRDLSPVERVGELWLKREDKFAPLGYGDINGSKLRACIWLIAEYVRTSPNPVGVVSGAVTGSPQHPMVAIVCRHFGLRSVHVVGTPDIDKHENLAIARAYGATFEVSKVGYAKALEGRARALARDKYPGHFVLETNITVSLGRNPPTRVERFHDVGATQVDNFPDHVETLILPAGSCNTATSVLYGIARRRPQGLRRILLMGIGNDGSRDPDVIRRRLQYMASTTSADLDVFGFPAAVAGLSLFGGPGAETGPYAIEHHDLNGTGFCTYGDLMPYTYHGVAMHPRYEGKIWHYMDAHPEKFARYRNDRTLFWIVGSDYD